jgi:hypothetical protein
MRKSYRCYLVCSSVPLIKNGGAVKVSHYVGTTNQQVADRLAQHVACGTNHSPHADREDRCTYDAARITAAFVRAGGQLQVTRVWAGGHRVEQRIKAYGKLWYLCPVCCGKVAMKRKPKGLSKGKCIK